MSFIPGWAIELKGDQFDLDAVEQVLTPPFDPWVEKETRSVALLLRSQSWFELQEASEVIEDAGRILDRVHGAMLLLDPAAQPLSVAGICRLDANGDRAPIIFAATGHVKLSMGRVRALGSVMSGGMIVDPPPPNWRAWLLAAETNDDIAQLLIHLTRLSNWADLYMCAECIERVAGGERTLINAIGIDASAWKKMMQTANRKRHALSAKYPLPADPPTLDEAKALVLKIARGRLS